MKMWSSKDIEQWRDRMEKFDDILVQARSSIPNPPKETSDIYSKQVDNYWFTITQLQEGIFELTKSIEDATVDIHIESRGSGWRKMSITIHAPNTEENYTLLEEASYNRGYVVKSLFDAKSYLVCNIIYGKNEINE